MELASSDELYRKEGWSGRLHAAQHVALHLHGCFGERALRATPAIAVTAIAPARLKYMGAGFVHTVLTVIGHRAHPPLPGEALLNRVAELAFFLLLR